MKNDDFIQHWSYQEILPSFIGNKDWVGKYLVYRILDTKTGLVKIMGLIL